VCGRDVHKDGLLVLAQIVDDVAAELEDFVEHIAHATAEAAPVGKDDQRQLLAKVEVL